LGKVEVTYYDHMASLNEEYYINAHTFTKNYIEEGSLFILQEEVKQDGDD
jgi:hypothetical protein